MFGVKSYHRQRRIHNVKASVSSKPSPTELMFTFSLPSNSVIQEIICYSPDNVDNGRIEFTIDEVVFSYGNVSSHQANSIDLVIDRGGVILCKVSGITCRQILVYYES